MLLRSENVAFLPNQETHHFELTWTYNSKWLHISKLGAILMITLMTRLEKHRNDNIRIIIFFPKRYNNYIRIKTIHILYRHSQVQSLQLYQNIVIECRKIGRNYHWD